MKIAEKTRFPYPVLSDDVRDFSSGKFNVTFGVEEDTVANTLRLVPLIDLSHISFENEVQKEKVKVLIDINCKDTYFNQLIEIQNKVDLDFSAGTLRGRVIIRPVLVTCDAVDFEAPDDLNAEFDISNVTYKKGEIVGWADEHILYVGHRKLAPIDSIFSLARDDTLEEGLISVDPDSDKILISSASRTFEHIDQMRKSHTTQSVIINSVYLPVIMQVLDDLRSDTEFKERDWYQTFMAKCDFLKIKPGSTDPLIAAQKLLKHPYKRLQEVFSDE